MINILLHLAAANPFPQVKADSSTIAIINDIVFGIIGGIAVLMMVIGGFRYIISSGDPQQTNDAKNTLIYAAVGLAVAISAYAIVSLIANRL